MAAASSIERLRFPAGSAPSVRSIHRSEEVSMALEICIARPDAPDIIALLERHLAFTAETSPEESNHALDPAGLDTPDVVFWTARDSGKLVGCAALKTISLSHGEVKSMHVLSEARGKGIAGRLLEAVISEAGRQGLERLSLETGSMVEFAPARSLYRRFGFTECPPFGDYLEDPLSTFMTRELKTCEPANA